MTDVSKFLDLASVEPETIVRFFLYRHPKEDPPKWSEIYYARWETFCCRRAALAKRRLELDKKVAGMAKNISTPEEFDAFSKASDESSIDWEIIEELDNKAEEMLAKAKKYEAEGR